MTRRQIPDSEAAVLLIQLLRICDGLSVESLLILVQQAARLRERSGE